MPTSKHLVTVWNPAHAQYAIDLTIQLLLERVHESSRGRLNPDEVYVWWGKKRSPNRQAPMPHVAELEALKAAIESNEEGEHHLYLTDYRSLYVADLARIEFDDVREDPDERTAVPAFYAEDWTMDCWFQLWDIRRLHTDDTIAVVKELMKLRNTRYNDRPVSLYGGMVDLPLIVTRPHAETFFIEEQRDRITGGTTWVEFDKEHSGIGETERDLRQNMIGEEGWMSLDPATRTFAASAEKIFRDHRTDNAFDFGPVVVDLAKAVEVEANAILRGAFAARRGTPIHVNVDGTSQRVGATHHFMLGELARIIGDNEDVNKALRATIPGPAGAWFAGSLPAILRDLTEERNPAAHNRRVDRHSAQHWRDLVLGVGCEGHLTSLGKAAERVTRGQ